MKKKNTRWIILSLVSILVLMTGCSKETLDDYTNALTQNLNNNTYIEMVKNGYQVDEPSITYGEAFEEFFSSPSWSYFLGQNTLKEYGKTFLETDDDEKQVMHVVEFTGVCSYRDVNVKVMIQFILDLENKTFELSYLEYNEVPQTVLESSVLLQAVFDNAREARSRQGVLSTATPIQTLVPLQTPKQDILQTSDDKEEAVSTTQVDYSNYVGLWVPEENYLTMDGEFCLQVMIQNVDHNYICGYISSLQMNGRIAGTDFNGFIGSDGTLDFFYDEDGHGNSGKCSIKLDKGSIQVTVQVTKPDPNAMWELSIPTRTLVPLESSIIITYENNLQTDYISQGDEILPSDICRITYDDLIYLSKEELALARNELYARHGYIFKNEQYNNYFLTKSWYYPDTNFDGTLYGIEKENLDTILDYEQMMGYR